MAYGPAMSSRRSPTASDSRTLANMRSQGRGRDTGPELALRRILHARGLRYRVDHPLPFNKRRRADIVFLRERVAVMVDGCYWHGCPEHHHRPKTNAEWWDTKIQRNRQRDVDTDRQLRGVGWLALRVWEHEDALEAADRVQAVVLERRQQLFVDNDSGS